MRFSPALISVVLSCVTQCMATWEQVYGSVSSMSTKGSGAYTTWYQMVSLGEEFTNDISFQSLLEVANAHWNYVKTQPNAFTKPKPNKPGTCLVAAVYIPGGRVILSTIPRGDAKKAEHFLGEMMLDGAENAPEWWAKKTGRRLDAEDAAVYLTEANGYIDESPLKVAVYGSHKGPTDTVGAPVNPCSDCESMLNKMGIKFYTSSEVQEGDADQYESEQLFKRSPAKPAKPAKKKTSASDSSSSAKVASSSSASSPSQASSSASVSSATSAKSTPKSSTKVVSSDSVVSAATVSSSTPSVHATSTGSGSAATTSGPTTSIKPIKLTAVPFPMSLLHQPGLNMTSSPAATTVRGVTPTAISVPTTLQTSTAAAATKLR